VRRPVIWSQRYDRKMADLFDLLDEIAQAMASALHVKLSGATAAAQQYRPSPPAYEALLKARATSTQISGRTCCRALRNATSKPSRWMRTGDARRAEELLQKLQPGDAICAWPPASRPRSGVRPAENPSTRSVMGITLAAEFDRGC
jgi:hypothetical protein